MNLLLADDHPLFRKALAQLLKEEINPKSIVEASNGIEVLELTESKKFDLFILDLSMPKMDGLETVIELRKKQILTPVLILSMHPDEYYAQRVLKGGASGYLSKSCEPNELKVAIETILKGNKYISPEFASSLATRSIKSPDKLTHQLLSNRELQVLRLIASGNSAIETAKQLSISVNSVATYKARILSKTGLKTIAEITRYSLENGLI